MAWKEYAEAKKVTRPSLLQMKRVINFFCFYEKGETVFVTAGGGTSIAKSIFL